jgi:hypothetical protein
MDLMAQFAVLTLTTIFAGALAFGMAWAFLQGAFRLMQPAGRSAEGRPRAVRLELVHGTRASAPQFALRR